MKMPPKPGSQSRPDQLSAAMMQPLGEAAVQLGQPHATRWAWLRKGWTGWVARRRLNATPPRVVGDYAAQVDALRKVSRDARRTRVIRIVWLWLRIVVASVVAVLRRYGIALLFLTLCGGLGYVIALNWADIIAFLAAQIPEANTPTDPAAQNPAQPGLDIPPRDAMPSPDGPP